jgi:hypothetical protein
MIVRAFIIGITLKKASLQGGREKYAERLIKLSYVKT